MSNNTKLVAEGARSLAFGSLGPTYANVGTATENPAAVVMVKNSTDAEVVVSWDGGVTDVFILPAGSHDTIDVSTNAPAERGFLPIGSQFQAKTAGSPTSGSVIVQLFYFGV